MLAPSEPITVTIAGCECKLRYPIKALKGIESELGTSILKIANQAADADISIATLEEVLFQGLRGADDSRPRPDVERMIENDYTGALQAFTVAITKALGADTEPSNNEPSEASDTLGE